MSRIGRVEIRFDKQAPKVFEDIGRLTIKIGRQSYELFEREGMLAIRIGGLHNMVIAPIAANVVMIRKEKS